MLVYVYVCARACMHTHMCVYGGRWVLVPEEGVRCSGDGIVGDFKLPDVITGIKLPSSAGYTSLLTISPALSITVIETGVEDPHSVQHLSPLIPICSRITSLDLPVPKKYYLQKFSDLI